MERRHKKMNFNKYVDYKKRWIVAISEIQDARFVLFGTRQLNVPASHN